MLNLNLKSMFFLQALWASFPLNIHFTSIVLSLPKPCNQFFLIFYCISGMGILNETKGGRDEIETALEIGCGARVHLLWAAIIS